jgi:SPP1 gp7 family putative phage head morphogenesis protein
MARGHVSPLACIRHRGPLERASTAFLGARMNPLLSALVQAGILSAEDARIATMLLDPAQAQAYAEALMRGTIQQGLSAQQARLVQALRASGYEVDPGAIASFWAREDALLNAAWVNEFAQVGNALATATLLETNGLAAWTAVNEEIIEWTARYYTSGAGIAYGSIPNINATSQQAIGELFGQWQAGTLGDIPNSVQGLPRLIRAMEPVFGPVRAQLIAETETTRIYSESVQAAGRANPRVTVYEVQSAADERVCPICGPLHGLRIDKGAGGFSVGGVMMHPPFHVRCRCRLLALTAEVEAGPRAPEDTFANERRNPV